MPHCKFPLAKWQQARRTIAEIADLTEDRHTVRWCMQTVLYIEQLCREHEDSCLDCHVLIVAAFEKRMAEANL